MLPVLVRISPTSHGVIMPLDTPMLLISAIPPAAPAPEKYADGTAQNTGCAAKISIAATDSSAIIATMLDRCSVSSASATAPPSAHAAKCQRRSRLRSERRAIAIRPAAPIAFGTTDNRLICTTS